MEIPLNNFQRGILATVGVYLLNACASTWNLVPYLYPYIGSYYHHKDSSITVSSTGLLASIFTVSEGLLMSVTIVLYSHWGLKKTYLLILTIQLVGNILASWTSNFYVFSVLFSVANAFPSGGFMYVSLYCVWRYFSPKAKGLLSGIVMSSLALFPVVTSNIAFHIINPDNSSTQGGKNGDIFPPEVASRFPGFIRSLAYFYFVVGIIGCALILEPLAKEIETTENVGHVQLEVPLVEPNSERPTFETELEDEVVDAAETKITLSDIKDCFKDPLFLKILVIKTATWVGYHFFMLHYKSTGLKYMPQADKNLNIIGNLSSISNALSRLGGGLLYKRLKYSHTQLVLLGILGFSVVAMQPSTVSFFLFGSSVCIMYVSYGLFISSYPLVFDDAFGRQGGLKISLAFGLTFSVGSYFNYLISPPLLGLFGEVITGLIIVIIIFTGWYYIPQVTVAIHNKLRAKSEKILFDRHKKTELKELQAVN